MPRAAGEDVLEEESDRAGDTIAYIAIVERIGNSANYRLTVQNEHGMDYRVTLPGFDPTPENIDELIGDEVFGTIGEIKRRWRQKNGQGQIRKKDIEGRRPQ